MKIELNESTPEVINKMIIASYINPVKEFQIDLKKSITPDQILEHKKILGGLELVDFEESSIHCQTSLALSDPNILLTSMIRKILSIATLIKKDTTHELIQRYEEEIDKSNLLIHKSIISTFMYRRESKLRHIDLYYIGMLSRALEQITDILIIIRKDPKLIDTIERMMETLLQVLEELSQPKVIGFIKAVEKLEKIQVGNLETYKKKRVYSLLGHIAEILCDWTITEIVDRS